ncbi:hypothetical protein NUW54_g7862 [Trametes sanguinea]|uniref:Uncharacterized protein n=1 Tax=Trametes sanguinea TaxID=158606 RepID=A0ACC1PHC9_9APHY|nr:hypothetical protein NUW54_g7862 [Trametes sanguinea]
MRTGSVDEKKGHWKELDAAMCAMYAIVSARPQSDSCQPHISGSRDWDARLHAANVHPFVTDPRALSSEADHCMVLSGCSPHVPWFAYTSTISKFTGVTRACLGLKRAPPAAQIWPLRLTVPSLQMLARRALAAGSGQEQVRNWTPVTGLVASLVLASSGPEKHYRSPVSRPDQESSSDAFSGILTPLPDRSFVPMRVVLGALIASLDMCNTGEGFAAGSPQPPANLALSTHNSDKAARVARGDAWTLLNVDSHTPSQEYQRNMAWSYLRDSLNFYRIHLLAFIFFPLFGATILWACNGKFPVKFIDSLFICISAATGTGLVTLDLSSLTVWQQVIVVLLELIGNQTFVSWVVVLVRRWYFLRNLRHIVAAELERHHTVIDDENTPPTLRHIRETLARLKKEKDLQSTHPPPSSQGTSGTSRRSSQNRDNRSGLRTDMVRRLDIAPHLIDPMGSQAHRIAADRYAEATGIDVLSSSASPKTTSVVSLARMRSYLD